MFLRSDPRAAPPTPAVDPETQIPVAVRLIGLGWAGMTLQEILLFARPTPYGGPYVLHWDRYFWFAILYNLLGLMVASLPFLAAWLLRRRPVAAAPARRAHACHLGVILFVTALDHADNEVMRFMGTHLTVGLLRTYERVGAWGADNLHIIEADHGGPFLPFVVLLGVPLLLWWRGRRLIDAGLAAPTRWTPRFRWSVLVGPLVVSLLVFNIPGGRFRRGKIQPELFTLAFEARRNARDGARPADYDALVRDFQAAWLADGGDSTWHFTRDTLTPLLRTPTAPATPTGAPWNVIYLQLETFRAWNVGHLHPDPRGSATPVIDSLAASADGATWTRHLSFGPPTVSGFVAGHCSIRPHAERDITTTYTYTSLLCLPELLRTRGWHTAYFTGSDPDWDNQTIWLRRWYDEIQFYRDADEDDRIVFGRAATRIRELGRSGKPFFATVISISNHYPFRSRDHAFDLTDATAPTEAIRNTMHFTDRVVGRFLDSLSSEPWFAHTLIVIIGDHGYNLGEHDGTAGQRNGWRESVWVPLVIAGANPRLPRGRHDEVASILDVAPTVSDLLGVRQPVPWLGRSLLTPAGPGRTITMDRGTTLYAEDDRFGLVLNSATGQAALYDPMTDPLQQHDIAASHPAETARLLARAARDQRLTDFLIETNRVWRGPATP